MKKKMVSFFLLAVFLACLSGCASKGDENSDVFYVTVTNHSSEPFEKIRYEYYLAETPTGGGDVEIYKGGTFSESAEVKFDFTSRSFPEGADLSEFRIELFVTCGGTVYPAGGPIPISAVFGGNYPVIISGDTISGFTAEITN